MIIIDVDISRRWNYYLYTYRTTEEISRAAAIIFLPNISSLMMNHPKYSQWNIVMDFLHFGLAVMC